MPVSKRRRRQREILHWAQNGVCAGCGHPIGTGKNTRRRSPHYPTFDHYDPRHLGGERSLRNGLLKHRKCNELRGGRLPTGCDMLWHWSIQAKLEDVLRSVGDP